MRVFVHLANGYDAAKWERRWLSGELPGFNERSPYGYHHAREQGCAVNFSVDHPETRLTRLFRGGLRYGLGFDIVHALRNRRGILQADVVWTHTESQHLSVALLLRLWPGKTKPKLVAQTVWLMDKWASAYAWQRGLYRWLMCRADVLTFHSPLNRDKAKALFPSQRCELVRFGISTEMMLPTATGPRQSTLNILALGNDLHRDWPTLFQAFGNQPGCAVRVATQKLRPKDVEGFGNIEVISPKTNKELLGLYAWASVVVLPLKPNLHASGITVLQEAALAGRPAVSSAVGGLDAYFTDEEVTYVESGNPAALRQATLALMADPAEADSKCAQARERMQDGTLGTRAFVKRHVELSHQLLPYRHADKAVPKVSVSVPAQL